MRPNYQDENVVLHHGDCIEVMRAMPDNSIDSIVTDPPYGLGFMGKKWDALPPGEEWARECLRVLKPGGHILAFGGTRTWHRLAVAIEDAGFEIRDSLFWHYGSGFPKSHDVGKAISKLAGAEREAQQWEGWGTALKPATEPVVMARKPFKGTVARNVLEHGTGAINIDASRVGAVPQGRFPANLILDEHTAELLDAQSGTTKSSVGKPRSAAKPSPGWGMTKVGREHNDEGGASRFFYVAKAPKSERPVVDGVAHATVKPLKLMRYLVRMVTPPGGTILEPFAGSGTTIEAALIEGFNVIGIEMEPDYLPLIQHRINRANGEKP